MSIVAIRRVFIYYGFSSYSLNDRTENDTTKTKQRWKEEKSEIECLTNELHRCMCENVFVESAAHTHTHQLISMALRAIFRTKDLQLHAIDLNMSEWVSAPSALFPYFIKWVIRIYETTFFDNDYKFYMPKNHSRAKHIASMHIIHTKQ